MHHACAFVQKYHWQDWASVKDWQTFGMNKAKACLRGNSNPFQHDILIWNIVAFLWLFLAASLGQGVHGYELDSRKNLSFYSIVIPDNLIWKNEVTGVGLTDPSVHTWALTHGKMRSFIWILVNDPKYIFDQLWDCGRS